MARGSINIEDDVMIAGNVQLLSNNHDEYKRHIITCEEINIKSMELNMDIMELETY